jgi:hypothetical protein
MTKTAERIASQLDARHREKQADIEAKYGQLIHKMALNEELDEEACAITCDLLGKSPDQVRADVAARSARLRDADQILGIPAALEEMMTATAAQQSYDAETDRILDERKAGKQAAADRTAKAQHDFMRLTEISARAIGEAAPQLRESLHSLRSELDSVVRERIDALAALADATAAHSTAKRDGMKKAELEPFAAAVESATSELAAADGLVGDWLDRWREAHEQRLAEPPAKPQPAPIHHPFGPGFPVR